MGTRQHLAAPAPRLQTQQASTSAWDALALDATTSRPTASASDAPHPAPTRPSALARRTSSLHLVADQRARPRAVRVTAGHAADAANLLMILNAIAVVQPTGRHRRRPVRLSCSPTPTASSYATCACAWCASNARIIATSASGVLRTAAAPGLRRPPPTRGGTPWSAH